MNLVYVTDESTFKEFKQCISKVGEVSLDTETSGLETLTCKLYSIQVGTRTDLFLIDLLQYNIAKEVVEFLSRQNVKCVGHNIKFDLHVLLANTGILLTNVFDTMIAEVCLNLGKGNFFYSLEDLLRNYFGVILDKEKRKSFYENGILTALTEEQRIYALEDIRYLLELKEAQETKSVPARLTTVLTLEMTLLPSIVRMELTGLRLDIDKWNALIEENKKLAQEAENELYLLIAERLDLSKYPNLLSLATALAIPVKSIRDRKALETITDPTAYREYVRNTFNTNSNKQMHTLLSLVNIDVKSTNEKVLKEVNDPLITTLLEYRGAEKRVTSFGANYLKYVDNNGILHYSINQVGARTGRTSVDTPAMQQQPREQRYRDCFLPLPGYKLLSLDYNQQEYRIAGAITMEPVIIGGYKNGIDMHTLTASLIYNKPIEQVTKAERATAKGVNFAILYGSTEYGLAYNFKISVEEARGILDRFYKGYPVFSFAKAGFEEAIIKSGFASTMTGRRRYFEKPVYFNNADEFRKWERTTKREGFNMMIQGTGADITKLALINLDLKNPFGDLFKPALPVHDEVLAHAHETIVEEAFEFMKTCMLEAEQPYLGEIPAAVEGKVADKWEH